MLADWKAKIERSCLGTLAGLLCPPSCVQCEASLEPGEYLCAGCAKLAKAIQSPFCRICSEPFAGAMKAPFACADCQARQFSFECAVSRYRSRGLVRDLILRFKYNHHHYLRRPLSRWLAETLDDERIRRRAADALVPVPLHPRRQRQRGFNQAELLCRLLGPRAGLPVWAALRRMRFTENQARLERAERLENLRGAFAPNPRQPVVGKHLLLVDDVFTTGSTVDECARTLLAAGAAGVRVLTVARG